MKIRNKMILILAAAAALCLAAHLILGSDVSPCYEYVVVDGMVERFACK